MALVGSVKFFHGILDDGQIEFRRTRVVTDGDDVFEKHFRQVLEPGQDVSGLPPRTQALCNFVWTPAVVAAYRAAKAARLNGP